MRCLRAVFVLGLFAGPMSAAPVRAYEGPQGFVANKYICYVDMTE